MQSQRIARREFLSPAHNEFLCIPVEVFLNERGRVHGIEQLVRLDDPRFIDQKGG
jgi:hypothetical protein